MRRQRRPWLGLAAGVLFLTLCAGVAAAPSGEAKGAPQRFVIIVGNNSSVDQGISVLEYADDDAVLYYKLFSLWTQRLSLLTVLDDDTQHRYRSIAAETQAPTRANLRSVLKVTYQQIVALQPETRVELVVVFVGHGSVDKEGKGYLHLQDGAYTRADLFHEVIAASPADFTHIIVDACNAFSFVAGRSGSGTPTADQRRLAASFLAGHDLEAHPNVGVLLATSDDKQTHEWSRIRGGVFSHQVRSALSGAADINRDGRIEYSEVAAFIDAANSELHTFGKSIRVFAWPPRQNRSIALLDLGDLQNGRYVAITGHTKGRFYLESSAGERWSEFHKRAEPKVVVAIPKGERFFLRGAKHEVAIPAGEDFHEIREAPQQEMAVSHRGAVDEAFERGLFAEPFTADFYRGFVSGHKEYIPVPQVTTAFWPKVARSEEASTPVSLEASYLIGLFALRPDRAQHGLLLRLAYPLGDHWRITGAVEAGYSDLSQLKSHQGWSTAVMPGMELRWVLNHYLTFFSAAEMGWGTVFLRGEVTSGDITVLVGRAQIGAVLNVSPVVAVRAAAGGVAQVVTIDNQEALRGRPEATLGLVFTF